MTHGAPDDSDVVKRGDVYRLDDMAELAARLGSPAAYHRFGTVVWVDAFDGGLGGWDVDESAPDTSVYVQSDYCVRDGIAAELLNASYTHTVPDIHRRSGYYPDTLIGFSVIYACDGAGSYVQIDLGYVANGVFYDGSIRILHASGEVTYKDSVGDYVALGTFGTMDDSAWIWYPVKLIVNTETGCYERLFIASTVFDMSNIPMSASLVLYGDHCVAGVGLYADSAGTRRLYVDDAVFTCNEEV